MTTAVARVQQIWNALAEVRGEGVFDTEDLAGLPDPARRYLLHSIQPGTSVAGHVRLEMHGHMRLKKGGTLLPMTAEQILAPPHGFVWRATVGKWYLRIAGHDSYSQGEGNMVWKLWNMLPVVRSSGPDISRSAAGRLAIESIFLPSSLLPRSGTSWTSVDDSTARAAINVGNRRHVVDCTVRKNGRLTSATMMRWGKASSAAEYRAGPFGTFSIREEKTFSGYTIPTQLSVGWKPGSEDGFEFFFAEITEAEFA